MSDLSSFASQAPLAHGVAAQLQRAFDWAKTTLEARRVREQLAGLDEREWRDVVAAQRDAFEGDAMTAEDPAETLARRRAIRAWYGPAHERNAA